MIEARIIIIGQFMKTSKYMAMPIITRYTEDQRGERARIIVARIPRLVPWRRKKDSAAEECSGSGRGGVREAMSASGLKDR